MQTISAGGGTALQLERPEPTTAHIQRKMRPVPLIRVLIDDNPKRLGSAAYTRFTFYEDGITVTEYYNRGGRPEDLKWDEDHHFIKLDKFER